MKVKKDKSKEAEEVVGTIPGETIETKAELKDFLISIREKLLKGIAPPVVAMSALNHVLTLGKIYELLDKDTKEIAQEIYVKLSQMGLQIRKPAVLFGDAAA